MRKKSRNRRYAVMGRVYLVRTYMGTNGGMYTNLELLGVFPSINLYSPVFPGLFLVTAPENQLSHLRVAYLQV